MKSLKTALLSAGVVATMFVALGVLSKSVYAASIGVSPSDFYNEALMRGSTYEREFFITRSDTSVAADVTISIYSDDNIEDWFTFSPGNTFKLETGDDNVSFKVSATVPSDAEYKQYTGNIVVQVAAEGQEGQVILVPGVNIKINLTVSDKQVRDFTVLKASVEAYEQGQALELDLEIKNDGNVNIAPSKVRLYV